jgi:glutamine synthetase
VKIVFLSVAVVLMDFVFVQNYFKISTRTKLLSKKNAAQKYLFSKTMNNYLYCIGSHTEKMEGGIMTLETSAQTVQTGSIETGVVEGLKKKFGEFKVVDFKFVDIVGKWQHFSIPVQQFDDAVLKDGLGYDGSSIRGFQNIHESDMLLIPDARSAFLDHFSTPHTLSIVCDVFHPGTMKPYDRDPRNISLRAEAYLKETGLATHSYWGPEVEFFILDSVRFDQNAQSGYYFVDSEEGIWNSGLHTNGTANRAYRPKHKAGYFPVPPVDKLQNLRNEMVAALHDVGIEVERQHHEVATAGQAEIDIKYDTLTRQADNVMKFKYVVSNVAHRAGKVVTFMPKPVFGDNGSGMHCHQSIWNGETNVFYDEKDDYAQLSDQARWYIGGLFKHAKALMAFCAASTNSYKRLVPGFEAPVNLVYSKRNRSAAVRIPTYFGSVESKRVEFRSPDATANPYLAFSAMLMAGIDGIQNKTEPGKPMDKDIYGLSAEEKQGIDSVPGSFEEALDALEEDHEFLMKGGVFSKDFIENYLKIKRGECDEVRLRPHPWEFALYFDH